MPPEPNPLPALVKGANLRPVGDPRRGYGTRTARETMARLKDMGVNTLAVLVDGRMERPTAPRIRGPGRGTLDDARQALDDARAMGLATLLVPHLYVEDGTWRGRLDFSDPGPSSDRWWASYGAFLENAAAAAEAGGATALAIGVELKAMSARPTVARRMTALAARIRRIFGGRLVYVANWDEAEEVAFWDAVDLAGVNGYYPLEPTPERGAEKVARRLTRLSEAADREVLVVEVGYRSSPLSHLRPWEWPEQVAPTVDELSQAHAWAAVLTHWLGAPGVRGLMLWVVPTDPDDPASEPRHGFSPLNKRAEQVIAEGFRSAPEG